MDAWLWWLCMAAPISMLLIYGDTILYLWIFWFLCSHAPSSLLLIQSCIKNIYIYMIYRNIYVSMYNVYICICIYIYMIFMYAFLTIFKPSHVFMPMRSEDLEPPGACPEHPDRGERRTSKKRWKILCAAAPNVQNRSGHRSEPKVFTGIDLQLVTTKTGIV